MGDDIGRYGSCGGGGEADQAVEDEVNKSTTPFSSRESGMGCSGITEDIGVKYALVDVSSSVIVDIVDIAGVGGSNDCIENGR